MSEKRYSRPGIGMTHEIDINSSDMYSGLFYHKQGVQLIDTTECPEDFCAQHKTQVFRVCQQICVALFRLKSVPHLGQFYA